MKTQCAICGKEFDAVVSSGLELGVVCLVCQEQEAGF
jgi:hypothetical protein